MMENKLLSMPDDKELAAIVNRTIAEEDKKGNRLVSHKLLSTPLTNFREQRTSVLFTADLWFEKAGNI